MIYTESFYNFDGLMGLIVLILLMILMLMLYLKARYFLPILVVFLFSLIMGINAMSISNFPLTPNFQIFFITFQTIIFIKTAIDLFRAGQR